MNPFKWQIFTIFLTISFGCQFLNHYYYLILAPSIKRPVKYVTFSPHWLTINIGTVVRNDFFFGAFSAKIVVSPICWYLSHSLCIFDKFTVHFAPSDRGIFLPQISRWFNWISVISKVLLVIWSAFSVYHIGHPHLAYIKSCLKLSYWACIKQWIKVLPE
jgi:hypothetical protein